MSVSIFDIFLVCFSPSLFWLGYWTWRGHLGTPKPRLVFAFFAAGFLGAPLALGLFSLMELSPFYEQLAAMDTAAEWQRFAWCLFAIGPVEELAKFLVAWIFLRLFSGQANPLLGGPLYAAATALGFATVENWYYMLEIEEVVWHRALTLPFNHVLFSSFWGVGLCLYELRPRNGFLWLVTSLALASVYHGLYDYILLSEDVPRLYVLPLVLVLWMWLVVAIPRLRRGIRQQRGSGP